MTETKYSIPEIQLLDKLRIEIDLWSIEDWQRAAVPTSFHSRLHDSLSSSPSISNYDAAAPSPIIYHSAERINLLF
jgi:hypothetical protein